MLTASEVLDLDYLDARCHLLEIAATLDRYDAAGREDVGSPDPRLEQLYDALSLLTHRQITTDRSERLLNLFSDLE